MRIQRFLPPLLEFPYIRENGKVYPSYIRENGEVYPLYIRENGKVYPLHIRENGKVYPVSFTDTQPYVCVVYKVFSMRVRVRLKFCGSKSFE